VAVKAAAAWKASKLVEVKAERCLVRLIEEEEAEAVSVEAAGNSQLQQT
jgi:hypothetical protein